MPTYHGQLGPEPRDPGRTFWDPDAQTMPRDQLRALQLERLRTMVGRIIDTPVPLFKRKLDEAGITSPADLTDLDDINTIPTTVKQDLRDSEAAVPPFGDYRFTPRDTWVRVGQSTGTTGTPTLVVFTQHDIWLEYESASRVWWRNGWRPGQIVTHAHPAYLYGGGVMLSGSIEYFGALNLWVAPPDTDELAEQGIKMCTAVHPDVSMVAFSLGRFNEVAAKLDYDGTGLPNFEFRGMGDKGMPMMTAGLECYAYSSGPCGVAPGGHIHEDWAVIQAIDPKTGLVTSWTASGATWWSPRSTVQQRRAALRPRGGRRDHPRALPVRRDHHPRVLGGRFEDFLDVQGRYFQLHEVENALRSVGEPLTVPSLEYVVVKPTDPDVPLRVRVEHASGDAAELASTVAGAIREQVGITAEVEVLERESLAAAATRPPASSTPDRYTPGAGTNPVPGPTP